MQERSYNVRNRGTKPRSVLIEHPFQPDWKLLRPEAPERTRDAYRFAADVKPGGKAQVEVAEERQLAQSVVLAFKTEGVRVMLSIGGITYTKAWNQALAQDAAKLGRNAALVAKTLGVGIEIDYEENRSPNLDGLELFIRAYRAALPYDATGDNYAARLTIDLAAGDRWLIAITRKATADWLRDTSDAEVRLDYANAMVPARQPSTRDAIANWQEHVDGKPQYAPPIPPLAPAMFTGSVYLVGGKVIPECNRFATSLQSSTSSFVRSVQGREAGMTPGMLGYK